MVFSSINHIIETRGLVDVGDLARNYYLSNRQFEPRKFKELSGFPPKLFSRIIRFQAALKEYGSNKSLTDIAHDCWATTIMSHFITTSRNSLGYNRKSISPAMLRARSILKPEFVVFFQFFR